jgi:hypothetical protein
MLLPTWRARSPKLNKPPALSPRRLPPVSCTGQYKFAFEASCWPRVVQRTFELQQVFRQTDAPFIAALAQIRLGTCDEEAERLLRSRIGARLDEVKGGGTPCADLAKRAEAKCKTLSLSLQLGLGRKGKGGNGLLGALRRQYAPSRPGAAASPTVTSPKFTNRAQPLHDHHARPLLLPF